MAPVSSRDHAGRRAVPAGARPFRGLAGGWWPEVGLVAGFAVITLVLALPGAPGNGLERLDVRIRNWCDGHRPALLGTLAGAGNRLGQGTVITVIALLLAILLGWRRHSARPVLPVLVAFALTFGSITPLKDLTDRAAPRAYALAHPERFGTGGVSYPSGHIVNAIVWYGVLALLLAWLLPAAWCRVIRVLPPVVLCVTTVYLSYHWLTDTAAGLLLGLFLERIMRRFRWDAVPLGRWPRDAGWDRPALGEAPERPDGSGAPERPDGSGAPERPDGSGAPERPDGPGTSGLGTAPDLTR